MKLTDEDIKKFQDLWKKHCKEDIDKKEAHIKLLEFVQFIKLIYRPIKKS